MPTPAPSPSPWVPALLTLLLALPAVASGEEPAKPATPAASTTPAAPSTPAPRGEMQMLIWGGGKTREQAEEQLTRFKEAARGWEEYYALAEGHPRILESKTVPGLKPGFFIVALGVCPVTKDSLMLDTFRAYSPFVYARPVTWQDESPSCPRASGDWKVTEVRRWKKKGLELTAVAASKGTQWRLEMELRDKTGEVLEALSTDSEEARSGAVSCQQNTVSLDESGPSVSLSCSFPGCTEMDQEDSVISYELKGGSIKSERTQLSYTRGQCD